MLLGGGGITCTKLDDIQVFGGITCNMEDFIQLFGG